MLPPKLKKLTATPKSRSNKRKRKHKQLPSRNKPPQQHSSKKPNNNKTPKLMKQIKNRPMKKKLFRSMRAKEPLLLLKL